ncbi:hypothetical protein FYC62_03910 [Pedobacter aquae]|uniref:Uncharacterized protein n=1 Tax=Pedobacter aquae TaxID=2605747 RepID=A0A5C0VFS8_9SPHI|nr:hypothetical protein [Pedobacter aquae]QEK50909.1 hypothetical protein FYC62_03910 [Pedobacter aquae]
MKNIILLFLSVFLLSCKKDCKILSYTQDGGEKSSLVDTNSNLPKNYIFDEKGRVVFNKVELGSDSYEYKYFYNTSNKLSKVVKNRFTNDSNQKPILFVIDTYTFNYVENNPSVVQVKSKGVNKGIGFSDDYTLTYYIEYEEDEINSHDNSLIQLVKFTQKDIVGKGGYFLQEHFGELPNKLIKSIVKTSPKEPSTKENYIYLKNEEDKIIGIKNIINGTSNKPLVINSILS